LRAEKPTAYQSPSLLSPSLWVFDRSDPYSSENFNIRKEPELFVKVIAGYALMLDAELGLNTFIQARWEDLFGG